MMITRLLNKNVKICIYRKMKIMLKISNLKVKLEDEVILKGLNLAVGRGQVHAIMGPNGSGKSTLSYVLSGKSGYEVTAGTAELSGENMLDLDPEDRAAETLSCPIASHEVLHFC